MDVPLLTKRVMHKPSVKEPGVPGVLVLTEKKFTFTPANPSSTLKLDVDFWAIKAIKVSGKGSKQALMNLIPGPAIKGGGFIFEFDNLEDREACKDLMGPLITQSQSTASNNQVAQGAADSNIEQLKAGMEHRVRLLLEDSELQKLHKELVIGGVLTDAEFWATRKHLLQEKAFKSGKQRTALKSAMFDIKHMNDGRYNTVNFNLTGDLIQQIFTEKPAVHRAYLTMVPHKLDEKEFWNKYFKAEYLHRTKSAAAAKAEADDDEELALFMKDDEILLKDAQRKIRKVDPTVDMASDYADDYTHLPGHGIIRGPGSENIEVDGNKPKRTLIQDLNRHAEVVLEGQTLGDSDLGDTRSVAEALDKVKQAEMAGGAIDNVSDEDRLNRLYEMTEMEDLQGPQTLPYASLHIQDPRKYFNPEQDNSNQGPERAGSFGTGNFCVDEVYENFGNVLLENRRKELRDRIINSDSALQVFNNLTQYISSTKSRLGKSPENDVLGSLPSKTKQELKEQWSTIQELLRHFWACYPITSTFLFDKANRLKNAMNQMYEKLERSKTSAQPEYRHQASMLIQPMLQALEAAFTHHEAESKKRSLKGTQKVNGVM